MAWGLGLNWLVLPALRAPGEDYGTHHLTQGLEKYAGLDSTIGEMKPFYSENWKNF